MPPKRKGKAASVDPAKQLEQEKVKRAENEVLGLHRQLQMLTIEHQQARQREQTWHSKADHFEALLARKEEDMIDITKAMARKSTVIPLNWQHLHFIRVQHLVAQMLSSPAAKYAQQKANQKIMPRG